MSNTPKTKFESYDRLGEIRTVTHRDYAAAQKRAKRLGDRMAVREVVR